MVLHSIFFLSTYHNHQICLFLELKGVCITPVAGSNLFTCLCINGYTGLYCTVPSSSVPTLPPSTSSSCSAILPGAGQSCQYPPAGSTSNFTQNLLLSCPLVNSIYNPPSANFINTPNYNLGCINVPKISNFNYTLVKKRSSHIAIFLSLILK
jgi:hypothetical protein